MSTKIKTETGLTGPAGGCGASPGGEWSALPAARRSRSRTRFAIVSPMR
jgi:hypothetical protein